MIDRRTVLLAFAAVVGCKPTERVVKKSPKHGRPRQHRDEDEGGGDFDLPDRPDDKAAASPQAGCKDTADPRRECREPQADAPAKEQPGRRKK